MTGRPAHSLRRAAPRRLLATPGWFLLMAASVALLTAAVAAPVLFLRAASDAALREELRTVEADAFASTSSGLRGSWTGVMTGSGTDTVLRALDRLPGFGPSTVSAQGTAATTSRGVSAVVTSGDTVTEATLYYRDGAIEALDPDGTAPPGIWLDREVAATLGVRAGDPVSVGLDRAAASGPGGRVRTTVAGVFDRSPGSALPAVVVRDRAVARRDLPWDPDRPGSGTPVALADRATFSRLALKVGEAPLWTADLDLADDLSPAQALRTSRAVQRLAERAFDEYSDIATATRAAESEPTRLQLASGLPDIVTRSRETAAASRDQSSAFVGAGVALGAVVVCAAAVLLGRSRRREVDLMAGLGIRPAEVAGLAALESLLPVAAGAVAGAALAWVSVKAVGPPGAFREGAVLDVVGRAAVAAVAAVALIAACAAVSAWLADRRTAAGLHAVRRRVPWEAALVVATVVSGIAVATTAVAERPSTPLAVTFPVLLAATVALGMLRLLQLVVGSLRSRATPGGPRWLAVQRARVTARETTAVALTVAVGLAVLGYALAVHRGVTEGVDDKVAAAVGARTVVELGDQLAHAEPAGLPDPPLPDSTVVWRQQVTLPPEFGTQPLLAIDRRTFADVAVWGSTGALDEGRDRLDRLERVEDSGVLPVVIAGEGHEVGDLGVMSGWEEWELAYQVVGVVPAFPGSASAFGDVAVLADAEKLFDLLPAFDPTVRKTALGSDAGAFGAELWSSRGSAAVAAGLERAGLAPGKTLLLEQAQARSRLLAAGWSSGYVVALGAGAVLLVGAAALLLAVRLADRDRVSDVLLRRMGFSARDLAAARTWEVAGVVGSSLLAAVAGVAALALAPSMIEPDVSLPPVTRPLPGLADVGLLLLVGAAMVLGGAAVARRRADSVVAAEVLRGNG